MEDINRLFDSIIESHQVFSCYPRLQKRKTAENLIVDWFRKHRNCSKICCIGSDAADVQNVKCLAERENVFCQYILCSNGNVAELKKVQLDDFEKILFISLHGETQIGLWSCEQGMKYESLYDYFSMHGLHLEDEFHRLTIDDVPDTQNGAGRTPFPSKGKWRNNLIAEYLLQKEKYQKESDAERKRFFWEKQFALAVYFKNFILVGELVEQAVKAGLRIEKRFLDAWVELQDLVRDVRREIEKRSAEDVILIWMDAVGYGDGDIMPYFQEQVQEGVTFQNAFTVMPNTNPTMRTIMNSEMEVDDYGYQKTEINENCRLISYMQKRGYEIKAISSDWTGWKEEFMTDEKHDLYAPASEILWDVWRWLLLERRKLFLLVHLMIETHYPHLSVKMSYGKTKGNYKKGRMEMDGQMRYYLSAVNKRAVRIFMSDHGQWSNIKNMQVNLVVVQQMIPHQEIRGMFSLVNFYKLMQQVVEEHGVDERELTQDYVKMQTLDFYNPIWVKGIIGGKKPLELGLFGYRGIADQKYIYQRYNMGKEVLVERGKYMFEVHIQPEADEICDKSLLPHYRELAGENPPGFYEDEKFRYTKFQYKLYENFQKYRNPAFALLNQFIGTYPDNSVAIRLGGEHSMEVYFWLSAENRKKVHCFIDNDPECNCSKLDDARIVPLSEAFTHKEIKAVLLSSYFNLPMLKKEAESYPEDVQVLDVYDYFAKNGCKMEHDFFDACMDEEGYEVGFPMG